MRLAVDTRCFACVAIVSRERLVQLAHLANEALNLRVAPKFASLCFEAGFVVPPIDLSEQVIDTRFNVNMKRTCSRQSKPAY